MVLEVTKINKSYIQGDMTRQSVLKDLNFELKQGESVAIVGESGSGKTTFLNCITGLDFFDSGSVKFLGKEIKNLKEKELSKLRNKDLGFVFQFHYLLSDFSVLENTMMPLLIRGEKKSFAKRKAKETLNFLKLESKVDILPKFLSGGEKQRVSIARALVHEPKILVMDEPTGNLDEKLTKQIVSYVLKICNNKGISIIVASHNKMVASMMGKIYKLSYGVLKEEGRK
jgi:lipoprotein-releasing system ATP-binding protein